MFATILLNDCDVRSQLDSGATVNVISQKNNREVYGQDSLLSLEANNAGSFSDA